MREQTEIDAWVTKYALTEGVQKVKAARGVGENTIGVKSGMYTQYFHGKDWHTSEKDALARADQMRLKKISALGKQIAKLEKMNFKGGM